MQTPDTKLDAAADTYRERNETYGQGWKQFGATAKSLFPDGVVLLTEDDFTRFHLYMLMIVKMTRTATANLQHADSLKDLAVYAAMLESFNEETQDGA